MGALAPKTDKETNKLPKFNISKAEEQVYKAEATMYIID